jgi:endonuclease/exonuclease/phosphatase family metal-dependent hydrolase
MPDLSFRSLARALDPVAPANRLFGSAVDTDLDSWYETRANTDAAALFSAIRGTCADPVGLIQHEDRGLAQLHRWSPAERAAGEHRSLRRMASRHGSDSTRARLLSYNTWLIDPPLGIEKPPDREERIGEIGRALDAGRFDVMALCEVFKKRDGEAIRNDLGFTVDSERGPGASGVEISSGLQSMVRSPFLEIVSSETLVYRTAGGPPDSLAQKGALYTEIDLGPGKIDLFLTHMYAEGADEDDGLSSAREMQTAELGNFIQAQRKPKNVVIVVGDFNVDSRKNEYRRLLKMLHSRTRGHIRVSVGPTITGAPTPVGADVPFDFELRLHDLWLTRGSRFGATAAPGEGPDRPPQFERICAVDDEGYCDDAETQLRGEPKTPSDGIPGYRLDYIFVEEPTDDHSFHLDVTRVRRRPFWRGPGFPKAAFSHVEEFPRPTVPIIDGLLQPVDELLEREIPHYLSDHLGLEVTLIASPRGAS